MKIGDAKSFKKAVIAFCLVGSVLVAADFGSYYLGRYGLSFVPFKPDGLWWILYKATASSVGGALAAAFGVYLGAKKKSDENESNDPA